MKRTRTEAVPAIPPPLTPNAARLAAYDAFQEAKELDIPVSDLISGSFHKKMNRITMQVFDIAQVKYESWSFDYWEHDATDHQNDSHQDKKDSYQDLPLEELKEIDRLKCNGLVDGLPHQRYRLILSDGVDLVSAKFCHESIHLDVLNKEGFCMSVSQVHEAVKNGSLCKGAVISFYPNSHIDSGKGIVTMFQLKIEGHLSTMIKSLGDGDADLNPIHPGVLEFSSRYLHQCTESLITAESKRDPPLGRPVLQLARLLKEKIGYCTIAGGAVLDQYLYELPACAHCYSRLYSPTIANLCARRRSNDVDLFIPKHPQKVDESRGILGRDDEFVVDSKRTLKRVLDQLYEQHWIKHTPVKVEKIRAHDHEEGGQDYGWMRVFVGLREKWEFSLVVEPSVEELGRPIQILLMDMVPSNPVESWDEAVVKSFDADIIKAYAVTDPNNGFVTDIKFTEFGPITQDNPCVLSGGFNYTIRPCHAFSRILARLVKYKQRGFQLESLQYDDRVTDEYRDHMQLRFQLKYANVWFREVMGGHADSLDDLLVNTLFEKITGLLKPEGTEQEQAEKLHSILQVMIRNEVQRTNGRCQGGEEINMSMLERAWGTPPSSPRASESDD